MTSLHYTVLACSHPSEWFPVSKIKGQTLETNHHQPAACDKLKATLNAPTVQVGSGWQTDGSTTRCDLLLRISQASTVGALSLSTSSVTHCTLYELTKFQPKPHDSQHTPPTLDAALSAVMDTASGQSSHASKLVLPRTELISVFEHKESFSQLTQASVPALAEETDNALAVGTIPNTTMKLLGIKAKDTSLTFPAPVGLGISKIGYFLLRLSCSWEPSHPLGIDQMSFFSGPTFQANSPTQSSIPQGVAQHGSQQSWHTQQQLAAAIFAAAESGYKRTQAFQKELESLVGGTGLTSLGATEEGNQLLNQFTVAPSVPQNPYAVYNQLSTPTANPKTPNVIIGNSLGVDVATAQHVPPSTTYNQHAVDNRGTVVQGTVHTVVSGGDTLLAPPTVHGISNNRAATLNVAGSVVGPSPAAGANDDQTDVESDSEAPTVPKGKTNIASHNDDLTDVEDEDDNAKNTPRGIGGTIISGNIPQQAPVQPNMYNPYAALMQQQQQARGATSVNPSTAAPVPPNPQQPNPLPSADTSLPQQPATYNPYTHILAQQEATRGTVSPQRDATTPHNNNNAPAVTPVSAAATTTAQPSNTSTVYNPHVHVNPQQPVNPVNVSSASPAVPTAPTVAPGMYNPYANYVNNTGVAPTSSAAPTTTAAATPATAPTPAVASNVYNPHMHATVAASNTTTAAPVVPPGKPLTGVVFVLSGFVNPKRSNLRDSAVALGAVCKNDWDPMTCTHLVTVAANTPKYNQVVIAKRPHAVHIVSEQWIVMAAATKARPVEFPYHLGLGMLAATV